TPDDADDLRKTVRTFPMTEHFDVEKTITSLGIGEALVTVLGPKGVPTPLAPTRLVPPDSLMSPIPRQRFDELVAASALKAKYSEAVDRDSAHELITRRIQAARASASAAAGAAVPPAAVPTTNSGLNEMTPAQQKAELKEQAAEQKRLEREAKKARDAMAKAQREEEKARQRQRDLMIREGGKMVRSRAGQDLLRSVFGTLLGGGRRR
ncbi:MAG: DUF853 family protein, partial [Chloroflexi bacterium]|nr:DUF853 family protein [Chloroflexota bacterium]